jgi:hypothetical protein
MATRTPRMTVEEHKDIYQEIATTIVNIDSTLTEPVQAGAARLDRIHPGWADKINLEKFEISSGQQCVIGQLYGDYDNDNLQKVFRTRGLGPLEKEDRLDELATEHGFYEPDCQYDRLQEDWVKAIAARQTKK